jgi:hypothetical protein
LEKSGLKDLDQLNTGLKTPPGHQMGRPNKVASTFGFELGDV